MLLVVLLVSVGAVVPAVTATSQFLIEMPIPVVAAEQTPSGSHFVISEDVKKVMPHWVLFAADEE